MLGGDDDHMARRVNRLLEPAKGTQGREGMNSRQKIIGAAAVLAALMGAVPAGATASSLLSGYGGPGQGSQAILGSALLNGPSNGGGGGGGSAGSGGAPGTATPAVSSSPIPRGAATKNGPQAPARHGTGRHPAPAAGSPAYPVAGGLARSVAGGSGALGLSGADALYIILALVALALTGAATRQLARGPDGREGTKAKAMRRTTRVTE
jgi:hypothetical protein